MNEVSFDTHEGTNMQKITNKEILLGKVTPQIYSTDNLHPPHHHTPPPPIPDTAGFENSCDPSNMDLPYGRAREAISLRNVDPLLNRPGLNKLMKENSCKLTTSQSHQTTKHSYIPVNHTQLSAGVSCDQCGIFSGKMGIIFQLSFGDSQ